ncbi:hypothetical protein ccbrp13_11260 [Ktedonobacteria bacterium brp13]|nr:hypothetical protein ccbrp13_11260 [Ktedonobacteria bacterium brp13]
MRIRTRQVSSLIIAWICSLLLLSSCTSSVNSATQPATPTSANTAQRNSTRTATQVLLMGPGAANQRVQLQVAPALRTGVFAQDRYLNVPAHFQISLYAQVPGARFMAETPDGNVLVSQPGKGDVLMLRPASNGGTPQTLVFVKGLRKPHDIVFHTINGTTYVYITESDAVDRFVYHTGDTQAQGRQVVVSNLPDSSLPELHGTYGHELKNIAIDGNNKLYLSIGSSCNVCISDTLSNPVRGAIYQYNADGTQRHLYARGLRNGEGLGFVPGTNELWAAINTRDNLAYPFQDTTGQYQKVVPSYVDNHPPDEFAHITQGANYGWPFCNPNPDNGMNHMPFDRDVQTNVDGHVDCSTMTRIDKGIQAHSAPLGLTFLSDAANSTNPTDLHAMHRSGALISLHGSWNRTIRTGFKVIYFPWNMQKQQPEQQMDLVTGWMQNTTDYPWGRPVDAIIDQQGNILISDDEAGAVYKLTYRA